MKKLLVLFLSLILFSSSSFAAWSWAGVASTMEGYNQAERQRQEDEAAARQNQAAERQNKIDQWRFEQEKKQHEEAELLKAKKIAAENTSKEVQKLIDLNPILKNWQQNDPDKWKQAIEYDDFLRTSDKYKNLGMTDRFNEVVRVLSAKFEDEDKKDRHEPAGNWVFVGRSDTASPTFFYVNKSSIKTESKNVKTAWILKNFSKIQRPFNVDFDSSKQLWVVACASSKHGIKQSHLYLKDEVVSSGTFKKIDMNDVVPDTNGESVVNFICHNKGEAP